MALLGIELEWTRPLGLWLLLLPIALFFLLRQRDLPLERATGTLELLRSASAGRMRPSGRSRRRLPPLAWPWMACLVAAALAVADPRQPRAPDSPLWELQVDRSPSMYLPLGPGETRTRLAAALARTTVELDRLGVPAGSRRWSTAGEEPFLGERPPASWSVAPLVPAPELGSAPLGPRNWISDRLPATELLSAGCVASGGAPVPGVVAISNGRRIVWNGVELVDGGPAPTRGVWIDPGLPDSLHHLIELWADERGLQVRAEGPVALHVEASDGAGTREVELLLGACGLRGLAHAGPELPPEQAPVLLEDVDGVPLMWSATPGVLTLSLIEVREFLGDPAAFALAWGTLLDGQLPGDASVVSFPERRGAGEARLVPLRGSEATNVVFPDGVRPAAVLSSIALLLAVGTLLVAAGRRSIGSAPKWVNL
jgi:hypothetical protein